VLGHTKNYSMLKVSTMRGEMSALICLELSGQRICG
jgi:hypothetical protein